MTRSPPFIGTDGELISYEEKISESGVTARELVFPGEEGGGNLGSVEDQFNVRRWDQFED